MSDTSCTPGKTTSEFRSLLLLAVLAFVVNAASAAKVNDQIQADIIATATYGAWSGLAAYAVSRGLAKLGAARTGPGLQSTEFRLLVLGIVLAFAAAAFANATLPTAHAATVVQASTVGLWIAYCGYAVSRGLAKLGAGLRDNGCCEQTSKRK